MITANQIKAARELLGWLPPVLAKKSGLSMETILRTEKFGVGTIEKMAAIQRALETAGVEFTEDSLPGIRMKRLIAEAPSRSQ